MIRHSSSLFLSLIVHTIILATIFYIYTIFKDKKVSVVKEKRVCINLSAYTTQTINKPILTPKKLPKKSVIHKEKVKREAIKKPTSKKKILQKKITPKKITPKKNILVVKKKVAPIKKQISKKIIPEKIATPKQIIEEPIVTKEKTAKETNAILKQEYIDKNIQKIRELIKENLYYPRSARKRKITGNVVVKFKLSTNADVSSIVIVDSQHKILSRAAIKTIENLSSNFPKPKNDLTLHVPISYSLR